VTGQPLTLSASFTTGADPTKMTALLDGVDITSQFGAADSNGLRSATVSEPAINYGKNQLQIRYDTTKVNSSFIFATAKDVAPTAPGGSAANSSLVPIKTRYLRPGGDGTHATDWGVQVGGNIYYAPAPIEGTTPCTGTCNRGFQMLFLNRNDLSIVANNAYDVENDNDLASGFFYGALVLATQSYPGCTPAGCILVMQSLTYVGYAGCYPSPQNCANPQPGTFQYSSLLGGIGASNSLTYANYTSPQVAYSFVGNVGGGSGQPIVPGTQNERLGCASGAAIDCTELGRFIPDNNSPAGDLSKIGAMSGVLIRDNYDSFTYTPNLPLLHYSFGTSRQNATAPYLFTNTLQINGSTTEGSGQYTTVMPSSSRGGFRLLILDRTNPMSASAKISDKFYDIDSGLPDLVLNLQQVPTEANSLVFLAAMGDISHSDAIDPAAPARTSPSAQIWNQLATQIQLMGGDPITFKILGDTQPSFNNWSPDPRSWDDYLLVTHSVAHGDGIPVNVPAAVGAESGFVINRHTVTGATTPTVVEGILAQDNEGYYAPRLQGAALGVVSADGIPSAQGIVSPQITSLTSASLLAPTPEWPFVATSGQKAAYQWISQELCCMDIRSSYVNLNADPGIWLSGMNQLVYPQDQSANFTAGDFDDVRQQLSTEFGYVTLVRNLQSNILNLYQSQQSNVGLILQQAQDEVLANIYTAQTAPPQPPTAWKIFTTDVFPTLENLAAFVPGASYVKTSLGLATTMMNLAIDHTNDSSGNSQTMIALAEQQLAASNLAQHAVNEYTDSLITLGNDFNRVLSDWGRLKTVAGPLSTGQLQWDTTASGTFLRGFNLTTRRQFYPKLIGANTNFFVVHIPYADDHYYGSDGDYAYNGGSGCAISRFHQAQDTGDSRFSGTGWYPGLLQVNGNHPGYYWYDIWALGETNATNDHCPDPTQTPMPSTYGMFDAINQNNPAGLGLWKPYFFERYSGTRLSDPNEFFSNVP
jgi:hypothetical protein